MHADKHQFYPILLLFFKKVDTNELITKNTNSFWLTGQFTFSPNHRFFAGKSCLCPWKNYKVCTSQRWYSHADENRSIP